MKAKILAAAKKCRRNAAEFMAIAIQQAEFMENIANNGTDRDRQNLVEVVQRDAPEFFADDRMN